ncbi:MAG: hypothetical protein K6U14_01065 [Firmicutes bacterium]|nr:hypothetical protein [Alicyclobacillaceae bacterium]MCL6496209.1 hypothetical protein [Bacillota bacterium]
MRIALRLSTSPLAPIHPIVVHWPFTLVVITLGAEIAYRLTRKPLFAQVSGWGIVAAVGFIALADVTGFLAASLTRVPAAADVTLRHTVWCALGATAASWGALVARLTAGAPLEGMGPLRRPTALSLGFLTACAALLAIGDHAGYLLVYRYLVGTAPERYPEWRQTISLAWGAIPLAVAAAGFGLIRVAPHVAGLYLRALVRRDRKVGRHP